MEKLNQELMVRFLKLIIEWKLNTAVRYKIKLKWLVEVS